MSLAKKTEPIDNNNLNILVLLEILFTFNVVLNFYFSEFTAGFHKIFCCLQGAICLNKWEPLSALIKFNM